MTTHSLRATTVVLALLGLVVTPALALTTFRAHLNGTLDGRDGEAPTQARGIEYAPGRCGTRGIMVTADTILAYPARGNISIYQGTFSMWIKPEGWRGGPDSEVRDILHWRPQETNKRNYLGIVKNGGEHG